jgi:hypothetical protein
MARLLGIARRTVADKIIRASAKREVNRGMLLSLESPKSVIPAP